ncbi:hypothetical protein ACFLVC_01150 [Chloroflexota bacterium]
MNPSPFRGSCLKCHSEERSDEESIGGADGAQIAAFKDTWQWGLESERALQEIAASAENRYWLTFFIALLRLAPHYLSGFE